MPGRPGQALTRREVEEIEAYNAAGVERPAKYDDVVYDGTAGVATYRWATNDEKRAATEAARDAARAAAESERLRARVRDLVEGRGYSEDSSAEEGSPFAAEGAPVPMPEDYVPGGANAPIGSVSSGTRSPEPMPAGLAAAMRGSRPVKRGAQEANVSAARDETIPVAPTPSTEAKAD